MQINNDKIIPMMPTEDYKAYRKQKKWLDEVEARLVAKGECPQRIRYEDQDDQKGSE